MKIVLGIDCSSSTIGLGILEIDNKNNINFINVSYIKPIKDGSIIERLVDTRNRLQEVILKYKPDYIGIEEIVKFMKGKSSANSIIMLATFNRMAGLLSYDFLKKPPELFNVLSIRHGIKINNIFPKKEDIAELTAKHLGITFPYEYSKKGKIKVENEDMADGLAVALYYSFILTGKIIKKTKKIKSVKRKTKK